MSNPTVCAVADELDVSANRQMSEINLIIASGLLVDDIIDGSPWVTNIESALNLAATVLYYCVIRSTSPNISINSFSSNHI